MCKVPRLALLFLVPCRRVSTFSRPCGANATCTTTTCTTAKPDLLRTWGGIAQDKKKKRPSGHLLIDFPFLSRLRFYPGPVFVQPRNWKLESQDPRCRPHCSLAKRLLR
ncbi:hypothetical protein J3F84DRAFT_375701 [Trichoderma pleuroticola]